jgi:hypothetical protein
MVHTVTLAWPRIPEAPEEEDISKDFLSNVAVRVESRPVYRTGITDVKT